MQKNKSNSYKFKVLLKLKLLQMDNAIQKWWKSKPMRMS